LEWFLVGALVIIWAAFLYSPVRRGSSPYASVEEFERNMGLLAETERATGRWIVAPRKGERFVGDAQRNRRRSRERRRRVFVALLETMGLTILIGLFPPLRGMWLLSSVLGGVLVVYVCVLLKMKQVELWQESGAGASETFPRPAERRPSLRPLYDERGALDEADLVHVIVRPARELQVAGV
jgi:hypothetical protein